MSGKHILIGGGSGFIGSSLTKSLSSKGYDVTIISRMPGAKRMTWHDLDNNGLPKNTFAIVNLAGQNVLDPSRRWSAGFKQNVWNSRINTSAAFAKAIEKADNKPQVFINVSGVSLYKPNENYVYTEADNGTDYDFMSKLCIHWEKAATLQTASQNQTRLVKLRSGVVIGLGGGMIQSTMLPFWLGLGGPIAPGNQPLPWIHITDICRLIQFCVETNTATDAINGVAPDIITNEDFSKAFAKSLNRPALFTLPEILINFIFGPERAALLTAGAKIKPEKAIQLGFVYNYPKILDACKEVVAANKKV